MRVVKVVAEQLLNKLIENRANHEKDYEDAKTGYLETAKEKLDELLGQVADGILINPHLNLTVPDSHLEDYDRAIEMLRWHTEGEIELAEEEFAQYVQDNWSWKHRWTTSNVAYISKSRGC